MDETFSAVVRYGYGLLSLTVFLEAVGIPVPVPLVLMVAGSACAYGTLRPMEAFGVSAAAMMLGNTLLFLLGRYTGWRLLGTLCRISVNPETCILRSAESFYRWGRITVVIAKFIPGIHTMAPPLAGSMRMPMGQFLWLNSVGVILYLFVFGGLGYLFSDILRDLLQGMQTAGRALELAFLLLVIAYVVYRIWTYRKHRVYKRVPRITAAEVANRLSTDGSNIVLADVRSHGYYDAGTARIKGSVRLEPNNLLEEIKDLPRQKEIYLYCT